MGVRLVRYNRPIPGNGNLAQSFDHDALINRDLLNQHPIYSITGLQEELNLLEDSIYNLSLLIGSGNGSLQEQITNNLNFINDLEEKLKKLEDIIKKLQTVNYLDTESIDLTHDQDASSLKADIKLWTPKDDKENTNAAQILASGLYVPKFKSKDTTTIVWAEEVKGESLSEIFNEGSRFSHGSGDWNDHCSPGEETSWYWDDTLQSFVQPQNTGSFNGFITKDVYDCYTHTCTIRSVDGDNDLNGIVIGYVLDESNNSHTLTAVCDRGGLGGNLFAIWYNYGHPGAQVLAYNSLGSSGGWSSVSGITFEIIKNKNLISACCSRFNSTTLDESMRLSINLDDYEWGNLFNGPVKYGYCNQSQASSFYSDVHFVSTYVATTTEFLASVNLSKDPSNGLSIKEDGLYSESFRISHKNNNGIAKENDGYWVEAFTISPDAYNIIQKKSNGYYVPETRPSAQADNVLQKLPDGTFYVRDNSNFKTVKQDNHEFVVGDFIYYHHKLHYQKARAIDSYDANIVGIVTKVIDENSFEYQWAGYFATDLFSTANGYIQGMPVYISDSIPGKVVQDQPDISKTVGYPVEDVGIIISIERGIQYNQAASIGDFKTSANTYNVRSDGFIKVAEGIDYKQSLIQKLIDTMNDKFKSSYMIFDNTNGIVQFKDTQQLYDDNNVKNGMTLFIKAF